MRARDNDWHYRWFHYGHAAGPLPQALTIFLLPMEVDFGDPHNINILRLFEHLRTRLLIHKEIYFCDLPYDVISIIHLQLSIKLLLLIL